MSGRIRLLLLAGCGLIAALEAPHASSSLFAGLAGPYTLTRVERPAPGLEARDAHLPAVWSGVLASLRASMPFGPAVSLALTSRRGDELP